MSAVTATQTRNSQSRFAPVGPRLCRQLTTAHSDPATQLIISDRNDD
ncbi:MAG: hypothetical protein BJ554DRAFT_399 [Olpidium bornovanus]|uniref:Uncharacterized protein n=1 Tax=Olpidium bornovanus TaxID=278681 RepID=A0A8H7ZU72_9FUNG|nr:MAG: hypothetical protein BJ554DRAFT_399 [Olpidium bornovanus]